MGVGIYLHSFESAIFKIVILESAIPQGSDGGVESVAPAVLSCKIFLILKIMRRILLWFWWRLFTQFIITRIALAKDMVPQITNFWSSLMIFQYDALQNSDLWSQNRALKKCLEMETRKFLSLLLFLCLWFNTISNMSNTNN